MSEMTAAAAPVETTAQPLTPATSHLPPAESVPLILAFAPIAGAGTPIDAAQRRPSASRARLVQAGIVAVAAAVIALSILVRSVNHDEGQYVAAIELARHGLPYLDFAYLQTPLQPLLFSPLGVLPAGWLLLGARLANGVLGLLTVLFVMLAVRGRVSVRSVAIAVAALICSESFLLASSLARNDALPMTLLAAAVVVLLHGIGAQRRTISFASAGLLLGLATSAKINAGFPAAAAGAFVLLRRRRFGWRAAAAFLAGGIVGMVPVFVLAAAAPAQFVFDNFVYNIEAPRQWWSAVGRGSWLEVRYRIPILIALAAQGTGLLGTIAAAIDRKRCDERLLIDLMILGALASAYLPVPAFAQYLVPLVPLAAVRFAFAIDSLSVERKRLLLALTGVCCALGLVHTGAFIVRTVRRGDDLWRGVQQGREIASAAAGHPVVALSPERVAGSDTILDRAFVTGPFLFRTSGQLSSEALRFGYSPNWQRIDAALDAAKPRIIVTGGEAQPHLPLFPHGLDAPLAAWAERHRYRPIALTGGLTLWRGN
jgi:hypothetical protein